MIRSLIEPGKHADGEVPGLYLEVGASSNVGQSPSKFWRLKYQLHGKENRFSIGAYPEIWAPVELWHSEAEHWSTLYQKGMRVLIDGRIVREEWEDREENPRITFKIEARRVAILPYRIDAIRLSSKPGTAKDPAPQKAGADEHVQEGDTEAMEEDAPPASQQSVNG